MSQQLESQVLTQTPIYFEYRVLWILLYKCRVCVLTFNTFVLIGHLNNSEHLKAVALTTILVLIHA